MRISGLTDGLGALGKPALWVLMLVVIALIGALDYVTGTEASFSLFYLFPVAFAAWWIGLGSGVVCSILCAVVWHFANAYAGQAYSTPLMYLWNSGVRFGFFLIVTLLLARLHAMLRREQDLSRTDFLTGAYNVRAFHEIAAAECLRASRYPQPLTLVYVDLDGFKLVNDRYGHDEGDRVLANAAKTLQAGIRRPDTLARLGGDEFALLLPQTDVASAKVLLPRLRDQLLAAMRRNSWGVTFSIGALTCPTAPASLSDVVSEADELMYEVKRAGGNAIRYGVYAGAARLAEGPAAIPTPEKGRLTAAAMPEGDA